MKTVHIYTLSLMLTGAVFSVLFIGCNNESNLIEPTNSISIVDLTTDDVDALLFMLEEEKLARDTYEYLDMLWGISQFTNIKISEQSHMNAVTKLLTMHNVPFTILPDGEFTNQNLQNLYDQFIIDGALNEVNALKVGATIEDLDIVDLETSINATTNSSVISLFESLQCGSQNHLRSFVTAIEKLGSNYTPQFLTQEEFTMIINKSHEQCK